MQTKALSPSKEKTTASDIAVEAHETPTQLDPARNSNKPTLTAKATSEKPKKTKPSKDVQCTFVLPEPEYESVQELRHKLSEVLGHKVKKGQLFRVATRILLNQTPAKLKAELAKLAKE